MSTPSLPSSSSASHHPGVICQCCNQNIGIRVRYRCSKCDDFDLCGFCEGRMADFEHYKKFGADHVFLKIHSSVKQWPSSDN